MNIKNEVLTKLQKISKKTVHENDQLKELNLDSLDIAELIVDIEQKYNVRVSDEELNQLKLVSDVVDLFEKLVSKK
ncbi:acyl carrier protein [Mycoplasmopsis pullorum]|uniref:phosphopantetheine-binding protein n=1 Tax=Mycoplasmopsis pullorum TaxID=48003 RepID=UPI0011196827|nr:phosphopantetheine-binding protein [Mycoplasmopsis pullorum]TNK82407.1 acyl carrier protein [Mycoplasmopsis pullorum]TNK82626.1 acyl carrier protein [Mycoplasmopsis pullorum]TNK84903.1 acyl carrier protein [Mycoplasmopsis pullorum]TNK85085.1 acyl carrier protein [Mycoplasmopsis pullorum]TNK86091.1 acyl carrier protein [Mycoplasmopsis pullorum]